MTVVFVACDYPRAAVGTHLSLSPASGWMEHIVMHMYLALSLSRSLLSAL